jgi:DNA-binding MarR family transcriptional regulator
MPSVQPSESALPIRSPKCPARHHRVFLSARDRADTPAGSLDFVIGESIAHIVVVTARLFDRQLALRLRRHNVPIGQWPFLLFLWANEDLSQRDLSRLMAIEESTVTNTIDRMERDGLISRMRTPDNRRRNQLRLTERARELMSALLPEAMQVVKTATHGMSEMEIGFLTSLLGKVQVNLADERARPLGVEPRAEPKEATDAAPDTDSVNGRRLRSGRRA